MELIVISWNVGGLGNPIKRKEVHRWISNFQKAHPNATCIFALQEGHYIPGTEISLLQTDLGPDWKGIFSSKNSRHNGSAIIGKNVDIHLQKKDKKGRWISAQIPSIHGNLSISSIYAPASNSGDRSKWMKKLPWNHWKRTSAIVGGDWNFTTNKEDKNSLLTEWKEKQDSKDFKTLLGKYNYVDPWYTLGHKPGHSFFHRNKTVSTRIDKWIIPTVSNWDPSKILTDYSTGSLSDHFPVILHLTSKNKIQRGPSYWKLNSSLLKSEEVRLTLDNITTDFLDDESHIRDKHLWWTTLLTTIKSYLKDKGRELSLQRNGRYTELINALKEHYINFSYSKDAQHLAHIEVIQKEIEEINQHRAESAQISSYFYKYLKLEKPTKQFYLKAKAKRSISLIGKLKSKRGTATGLAVLEVARKYYKKLYKGKKVTSHAQKKLLASIQHKLLGKDKEELESPLSVEELNKTIKQLKKGKSPGLNGLSAELFQLVPNLVQSLLIMWNFSVLVGYLPNSTSQGVITLIYKKNDKEKIENYRPITLLNIDYKIIAASLATRLKKHLAKLVGLNQRGFVPGRDIRVSILEAKLGIQNAIESYTTGAFLMFDWEKAFDRVDRSWIFQIMDKMNFGSSFIKAIQILHTDSTAVIQVNGHLSDLIQVISGVRQGCPIAPFLFALTTEPLRATVDLCSNIKGITINGIKLTLSMFADDTSAFIGQEEDVEILLSLLQLHGEASGGLLNHDKTSAIVFNNSISLPNIPVLSSNEVERFLGAFIGHGNQEKKTMELVAAKMDRKIAQWSNMGLSRFGRAMVANSSIASHIWFFAQITYFSSNSIKLLTSKIWRFMDGKEAKKTRISYNNSIKHRKLGGLSLLHVPTEVAALQAHWMVRFFLQRKDPWTDLLLHEIKNLELTSGLSNLILFPHLLPIKFGTMGWIANILLQWSKIPKRLINNEIKIVSITGDLVDLDKTSVKTLYKIMYGSSINDPVISKYYINPSIKWNKRWKALWSFNHLTPHDIQFRQKIWLGKLWTYDNRTLKQDIELICPLCLFPEKFNHPVELDCEFCSKLVDWMDILWTKWTGDKVLRNWWNGDWIPSDYQYRKQMDLAITLMKRKIWNNYTKSIFNQEDQLSEKAIFYNWFGSFKASIKTMLVIFSERFGSLESNPWSLNNEWAKISNNAWSFTHKLSSVTSLK